MGKNKELHWKRRLSTSVCQESDISDQSKSIDRNIKRKRKQITKSSHSGTGSSDVTLNESSNKKSEDYSFNETSTVQNLRKKKKSLGTNKLSNFNLALNCRQVSRKLLRNKKQKKNLTTASTKENVKRKISKYLNLVCKEVKNKRSKPPVLTRETELNFIENQRNDAISSSSNMNDNTHAIMPLNNFLSSETVPESITESDSLSTFKECLGVWPCNEGSLLVALKPHSKLYMCGYFWIKLLIGNASVYGYSLKPQESRAVYSLQSHNIFSINANEGSGVDDDTTYETIPIKWLKQMINLSGGEPVVVVSLSRFNSDLKRFIAIADVWKVCDSHVASADNCKNSKLWKDTIDAIPLSDELTPRSSLRLFYEQQEWGPCISSLENFIRNGKDVCVVITGGLKTGKSTFLKYVLNKLLSISDVSEVACIDLDPGQPEFSQPGCLSLNRFSSPVLGPPFTHQEGMTFSCKRDILLGDLSVNSVLVGYLGLIETFVRETANFRSSVPHVVNTMGYSSGMGLDLMMDIIRIVRPSHVVTLESQKARDNFACKLTSRIVDSSKSGVITKPFTNLSYEYFSIHSVMNFIKIFQPSRKQTRDLTILSHFSPLWKNQRIISASTCATTVKISWTKVALHTLCSYVPFAHILQVMNGSLVALCKVNESCIEFNGDDTMPKKLNLLHSWINDNVFFGWGIVQGIDPGTKEFHLLTPIKAEQLARVNAIIAARVHIPMALKKLFYFDSASYWEEA